MKARLAESVVCHGYHDSLLLPPGSVLTGNGEMYKVFTPFRQAFIKRLLEADTTCVPAPDVRGEPINHTVALVPFSYPQCEVDNDDFPCGERAALQQLRRFAESRYRITTNSGISPRSQAPVNCRRIWHLEWYRRANVLTACALSAQRCWNGVKAEHLPGLTSWSGVNFTVT